MHVIPRVGPRCRLSWIIKNNAPCTDMVSLIPSRIHDPEAREIISYIPTAVVHTSNTVGVQAVPFGIPRPSRHTAGILDSGAHSPC